jgi:hypothetical protein
MSPASQPELISLAPSVENLDVRFSELHQTLDRLELEGRLVFSMTPRWGRGQYRLIIGAARPGASDSNPISGCTRGSPPEEL